MAKAVKPSSKSYFDVARIHFEITAHVVELLEIKVYFHILFEWDDVTAVHVVQFVLVEELLNGKIR